MKKVIRLTESQIKKYILGMVNESVPGLRAAEKAHRESGKENKAALSDIEKEISKSLKFDGNDNPEFPKQIKLKLPQIKKIELPKINNLEMLSSENSN